MTPEQLATALVRELRSQGLAANLGRSVQCGHKVAVFGPDQTSLGNVVVYYGAKGPKRVDTELRGAGAEFKNAIDAAWSAALMSLSTRESCTLPTTGAVGADQAGAGYGVGETVQTTVEVWLSGACIPQPTGLAFGWGILVSEAGKEVHRASGSEIPVEAASLRNVAAHITAAVEALRWCQERGILRITINCRYEGLQKWACGTWRPTSDYARAFVGAVNRCSIEITWTPQPKTSVEPRFATVEQLARAAAGNANPIKLENGPIRPVERRDQTQEYASILAEFAQRWVIYGVSPNLDWEPLRRAIHELAIKRGYDVPSSDDQLRSTDPESWSELAERIARDLESQACGTRNSESPPW